MREGMDAGLHIGAQVYVSLCGETVGDLAVGEARPGLPMSPGTLMAWFSAVKPVTAVAVAQLWEQDRLSLDDPVSAYLPAFGCNGKEAITVRHLLTHTGGFRTADYDMTDPGWEQTIARICEAPLEPGWVPGERAGYHIETSWYILGALVQHIDGRPFGQYVREAVFVPLGMPDSWLGLPEDMAGGYAGRIGQLQATDGPEPQPYFLDCAARRRRCSPGSGGYGPIHDLGRFYEGMLGTTPGEKPQILTRETIEAITARHRQGMRDETFGYVYDWGLGFMVDSRMHARGKRAYDFGAHASPRTFGHGGFQCAMGFGDPEHGLAVAWVLNGLPGEAKHMRRNHAMNSAIYDDLGLA
jgi:CubicO group peptidase (beta-lactamase class C family)